MTLPELKRLLFPKLLPYRINQLIRSVILTPSEKMLKWAKDYKDSL